MFKHDLSRLILALNEGGDGDGGGAGGASSSGQGSGGQGDSSDGGDRGGAGGGSGTGSGGQSGSSGTLSGGTPTGRSGKRKLEDLTQDELIGLVREHRGEAADHRTKRNAAEQAMTDLQRKVAEAFGIDVDGDGKPDPEKLAADLARAQDDARMRAVELAVYRAASDKNADPVALLDSRSFLDSVAELDPNTHDFPTRLSDKIAAATKDNPRLSAGGSNTGTRPGGGIGQGGRGPQSGPTGVAAGRALHPAYRERQNATSTT